MKPNKIVFGNHISLLIAASMIALLWSLIPADNASAHGDGGRPRLSYRQLGENYLHAWTSPAIARAGDIHVEALLTDQTFRPVGNARVVVKVTPLDGHSAPMRVMASATIDSDPRSIQNAANVARQEASFKIDQPGEYEVEITVLAAAGQGGREKFTMRVFQVNRAIKFAMHGVLALLVAIGVWLFAQGIKLARQTI